MGYRSVVSINHGQFYEAVKHPQKLKWMLSHQNPEG